jgi:type I restriction enzyme R subunit
MERMDTIKAVSDPKFWASATLDRLETVRKELRELVYILIGSIHERFFIDISDTMEEKEGVEKPEMDTDYRTRILDYLNEHRDHAAIQKIFRLEQLTIDDTKELEKICWQELGTKEEYEAFVNKGDMLCGDKLAVFIRSIIGIDRKIAKERFSKFLSDNVLTALQEEFINQIIGYVCENGDITPMTIVTNESFDGIVGAFGVNMVNIRQYVEELHEVIA